MNLHQLRYVCEIVRCKLNISRAAKSLGTSQPAISQQVRLLEEELGIKVFLRSRNGLIGMTPQGEAVVESAKHVLAEVANVRSVAQNIPQTSVAKIRVASTHAQARYTLPQVISRFRKHFPDLDVHITQRHDHEGALWQSVQDNEEKAGCFLRDFGAFSQQQGILHVRGKHPEFDSLLKNKESVENCYDFLVDHEVIDVMQNHPEIMVALYKVIPEIVYGYHEADRYAFDWGKTEQYVKVAAA